MTTILEPKAPSSATMLVCDAWNRLVEPTADSAHFDESHAPSAALPASSVGAAISASAEAADVKEADTGPSRALAFAQWPLVFSATMRAVLAGSRRRSQSGTVQLPPRRNRQAVAP